MKTLIREIPLSNGLTVQFFDSTRRYFGDYHQVRVQICCEVALTADLFADDGELQAAVKLLGAKVLYRKDIEQQGVPTALTAESVDKVISQFLEHSLGYFQGEAFARRFVQSELNRVRGRAKSYTPLRSNG